MRMIPLPSCKVLRSLLLYNKRTGVVTWKILKGSRHPGTVVGCPDPRGYYRVRLNGTFYYLHRVIWKLETSVDPGNTVDHKDLNKSNNRWRNLRLATSTQQHMNRRLQSNNTNGVKGIRKEKRPCIRAWQVRIYVDGKEVTIGRFRTKREAVAARRRAEKKHYKQFRRVQ